MNFYISKNILIFFLISSCFTTLSSQEKFYREGAKYFEYDLFQEALEQFEKDQYSANNKDLILKRLISNYEINNLEEAKKDVPVILAFEKIPDIVFLYIAKIYHAELNFDKAVEYYKFYLGRTGKADKYRAMVIGEIKRCATGLGLQFYEQKAFVENMGPDINSPYNESDPIQSPNYLNKYYFSSNRTESEGGRRNVKGLKDDKYGKHYHDMYSGILENGKWTEIKSLNTLLNTAKHERVLDFNTDGSILFFLKGESPIRASIHVDTFGVQTSEIYPPKFKSPLYGEKGDVYLQFYNDSTIIFSSRRKGGFGGYDLYVCHRKNENWSQPKNLGPNINGPYDEISPYLTKDGMQLYFSSNNLKSIGGFDIFHSEYSLDEGKWGIPENLKIGINSALDDTHYRLSADGQSAYFTSTRKNGYGQGDLYTAYLKDPEFGQLSYNPILPFIANDQFVQDLANNRKIVTNNSGSKANTNVESVKVEEKFQDTKKREFVIDPLYYGVDENLFTLQNQKVIDNLVDIMNIYPSTKIELSSHSVKESQIAYELYFTIKRAEKIAEFLIEKGIKRNRISLKGFGANYPLVNQEGSGAGSNLAQKLNRRIEIKVIETEGLPLEIEYNEPVVADFLKDVSSELYKTIINGLSYKVQIATVRQMYQNEVLNLYQDAVINKDFESDDYVYSIGLYKNYFDAQDVLKALRNDNISDAKIVPYIDGEKMNPDALMDFATKYPDLVNYLQYNGQ